jgi:hypothetical protein
MGLVGRVPKIIEIVEIYSDIKLAPNHFAS